MKKLLFLTLILALFPQLSFGGKQLFRSPSGNLRNAITGSPLTTGKHKNASMFNQIPSSNFTIKNQEECCHCKRTTSSPIAKKLFGTTNSQPQQELIKAAKAYTAKKQTNNNFTKFHIRTNSDPKFD